MAIAFDATATAQSTTTTSLTFAHTVAGSNRIMIVGTVSKNSTDANRLVSTVTYNGVGLTKIREDDDITNNITSGLWYLVAPATGTHDVVITWAGAGNRCGGMSVSLTGVDQSSPIDNSNTAKGTASTTSTAVTTVADNCWVVDSVYHEDATTFDSAGGSQTIRQNLDLGSSGSGGFSTLGPKTPAGSVTNTWTQLTSDLWISSIASIKPTSTGDLTVSVSDSVTVTESVGRMEESFINKSDSVTVTESIGMFLPSIKVSDNVTVTESVKLAVESFINKSDSVTVTEALTLTQAADINVSDSVTISESVSMLDTLNINKSESVTVSENTVELIPELFISKSESVTVSESTSASRVTLIEISVSDSIDTSEELTASGPDNRIRFLLDGSAIRAPIEIIDSFDTQYVQNRVLEGSINRDYFGDSKRFWRLIYKNLNKSDYDVIKSIHTTYLYLAETRSFQVTGLSYIVDPVNVHVDVNSVSFSNKGTEYLADFNLDLVEN